MRQGVILGVVISLVLSFLAPTPALATTSVTPQPVDLPKSPVLVTGYQFYGSDLTFVQLYNNSSNLVALDGWQLEYLASSELEEQPILLGLEGYLLPRSYAVLAGSEAVKGSDSYFQLPSLGPDFKPFSLTLSSPADFAPDSVLFGQNNLSNQRYELTQSTAGNYTTTSKFASVDMTRQLPLYGGGLYEPAEDTPLRIVALMANARACGPLEADLGCFEFIKLYNASLEPVDLDDYRLRFGYGNERSGIANTIHLTGKLEADSYLVVKAAR